MVFGKKDRLIGLDIGSRSIKAAEISETKKGNTLERFGIIDIAPGLIEDGAIKDAEQVADIIRQMFKNYGIKGNNVALSVGGYSVIVKKLMFRPCRKSSFRKPSVLRRSNTYRLIYPT
jgi:type IV pilus assembly protein PilM